MAFQSNFPDSIPGANGSFWIYDDKLGGYRPKTTAEMSSIDVGSSDETIMDLINRMAFNIGDIKWSSADLTQVGFLVANGAEVGRATYPDLCAVYEAMGFPWGAGDGSTTFNLPNLIGKFPEGANQAGGYHEAGLPNITGTLPIAFHAQPSGAFDYGSEVVDEGSPADMRTRNPVVMDASKSNSIYGNSTTVQPPSALLIPYVKAFASASADSTDLAITEVANDVVKISEKINERVHLVESAVNDDGSWYRLYSDGWVEQGGKINPSANGVYTISFLKPMKDTSYMPYISLDSTYPSTWAPSYVSPSSRTTTTMNAYAHNDVGYNGTWSVCGMGAK